MKIYSAASEQTLRARRHLKEWTDEGFLSDHQYRQLEQETVSDLRTTNLFLRIVLFVFSLLAVAAAVGLFFVMFLTRSSSQATGIALLIFAGICYAAAENAASQARLYRHGIEEALAVCSVGFLCAGLEFTFDAGPLYTHPFQSLILAVGAGFSLWIWRRFGLWYTFLAAMIFVALLSTDWTSSRAAQHVIVAALYAAGLALLAVLRSRKRAGETDSAYSLAEALLWLGVYIASNLKISGTNFPTDWLGRGDRTPEFPATFYWATWVLIWCLPPIILARGVALKDRFILAVGGVATILTFVSNKPYLGWQRHTWDPMLLGLALLGTALFLRRWLAKGPGGVREGFTAARLSKRDIAWIQAGSSALGLVSPQSLVSAPQTSDSPSLGGASGGGGASRDF